MAKAVKTHYKTVIIVEGAGEFPIDMMRYDSCVPATQSDVRLMLEDNRRRVALFRFSPNPNAPATYARWHSFQWNVVADSARDSNLTEHMRDEIPKGVSL